MSLVKIDESLCKGCELCVHSCPKGCLVMSERINSKGYFLAEFAGSQKCNGCTFCAIMCPDIALTVYK